MPLTIVLTDVMPRVRPSAFVEDRLSVVFVNARTPVVVRVVDKVR